MRNIPLINRETVTFLTKVDPPCGHGKHHQKNTLLGKTSPRICRLLVKAEESVRSSEAEN